MRFLTCTTGVNTTQVPDTYRSSCFTSQSLKKFIAVDTGFPTSSLKQAPSGTGGGSHAE